MSKSRPQVKSKLNKWHNWLINHVPKPIKDGASKAFKTFKDKVMGLYNRVPGSAGKEMRIKEPKPFKPIELEQAFGRAYRSYYPGSEVPKNVQAKTAICRTSERSERRGRNLWSPWTITSFWSLPDCMSNCFVKTSVAPQFDYKNVSCTLRRKPASKDN